MPPLGQIIWLPYDQADPSTVPIDIRAYGAVPGGFTDCTVPINNAFTAAITRKTWCYIPAGVWRTTGTLRWADPFPRIFGTGMQLSVVKPDATTYPTLWAGTGAEALPGGAVIQDLGIEGPVANPTKTSKAAVLLDAVHFCKLRNLSVQNHDIGIDLVHNCYGVYGESIYIRFGNVNVALNLRQGFDSGSDTKWSNCWLNGGVAGAHIAGGGGGHFFSGGQLSSGQGTAGVLSNGAVVVGRDYETGATGEASVTLDRIDIEGVARTYAIHSYDQTIINVRDCAFLGTTPSGVEMTAGIYKWENWKNSQWHFTNCRMGGAFSDPTLRSANGSNYFDNGFIHEDGWYLSQGTTAGGAGLAWPSVELCAGGPGAGANAIASVGRFKWNKGGVVGVYWADNGILFRTTATAFEKSTNSGSTWVAV